MASASCGGLLVGSSKGGLGDLLIGGPCRGRRGGASDAREEQKCKCGERRLHICSLGDMMVQKMDCRNRKETQLAT